MAGPGRSINHAILVVGYGSENGTPYWKVRDRPRQTASRGKVKGEGKSFLDIPLCSWLSVLSPNVASCPNRSRTAGAPAGERVSSLDVFSRIFKALV